MLGQCSWDIDVEDCCAPLDPDDPKVIAAIAKTSAMMTRLSGYTIGLCDATLRPLDNCHQCRTWCCGGADGIRLSGPHGLWVHEVIQVNNGGVMVDPATWEWDHEEQVLWRTPPDRWPTRDTRWEPCGTPDAFCVDVKVGSEPDAWALSVANELACEIVRSCTGAKCRLPKNATQVVGQGVTVTLSDQEIKTLIPEVAGWVDAVNPLGAVLPARIFSPDLAPSYRGRFW